MADDAYLLGKTDGDDEGGEREGGAGAGPGSAPESPTSIAKVVGSDAPVAAVPDEEKHARLEAMGSREWKSLAEGSWKLPGHEYAHTKDVGDMAMGDLVDVWKHKDAPETEPESGGE